jgi:hypothetical protein
MLGATRELLLLGNRAHEPSQRADADRALSVFLLLADVTPGELSRTVVDLDDRSVFLELDDEQVIRLCAQRDPVALRRLDLDEPSVVGLCVVALRRTWQQLEVVVVAREHFAQTPHEVTIGGEGTSGEAAFEFGDEVVESFDDAGDRIDRSCHAPERLD